MITLDRIKNVGLKLSDLRSLNLPDGIVPSLIVSYLNVWIVLYSGFIQIASKL